MPQGIAHSGVLSKQELSCLSGFPSQERLNKRPVAVIECNQEIPCNPCESACPVGAIKIGRITNSPKFDENKCNGCGLCIAPCPGLAVFVVDVTHSEKEALIQLPHEFLPLPKPGDEVSILNRSGKVICQGKVLRVRNSLREDHTAVVSVVVPKKYATQGRAIILGQKPTL